MFRTNAWVLLLLVTTALSFAADPYTEVRQLKFGQASPAILAIQSDIAAANPEQLRAVEAKLIAAMQAPETTPDAKSWICRTLRFAGSEQAVPALAALLTDKQFAADAQFALRSIPGAKVDEALRAALARTDGLLEAGVVQTLGARADRQSVPLIAPLASEADPVVAEAALFALGHIGGAEALKAVQDAKVGDALQRYRQHAILLCAESLLTAGNSGSAARAYRDLYQQSADPIMKAGALHGLVKAEGAAAAGELRAAIKSDARVLRSAAVRLVASMGPLQPSMLNEFKSWAPETQAAVLGLATNVGAYSFILTSIDNGNEDVRAVALEALGRVGNATDIRALLTAAAGSGRTQDAARRALQSLRDPAAGPALVTALKSGPAGVRCEAIRAVVARNQAGAVSVLLELAADAGADQPVRAEAQKALGQLAAPADLPKVLDLLAQSRSPADREAFESTAANLIQRAADKPAASAALLAGLTGKTGETKCAFLRLAATLPGPQTLEAQRAALADPDAAVKNIAFRCLAEWPDAAVAPDLLRLARAAASPAQHTLALRGFIRVTALSAQQAPAAAVKQLGEALGLASSPDEKKALLAALMEIKHVAALDLASTCLADSSVEVEAANTVVRLARGLQATNAEVAGAAVRKILDTCKSPAARQLAENAGILLGDMVNIAPQGTATSPDGLESDGQASGDQAAIDGNPATYWDEEDNAKLYRLVVTFKQPEKIAALSILGYAHHNYAPKDFEVLCNGKAVRKIENAQYTDNLLVLSLPETTCQAVEVKITGYYGRSPAIRELGLYQPRPRKAVEYRVLVFSKTLGFRHANIPLGVEAIRRLGAENGFAVDATEDSSVFTAENLARYKTVVFLSATGDVLNEAQEKAFREYVLGGGGFAGIHGALFGPSACEDKWAWYGELCCVSFKNHSAVVPATVDVEDHANPSTAGLPDRWVRTDEWYNYDGTPRGQAHVLATIDETTYKGGTVGQDHPMAWCKSMGKGIMWYTAMGHTDESFREPLFLKHILGGIELTAGVKTADLTPNPRPRKE